jgi:hypothetical protein
LFLVLFKIFFSHIIPVLFSHRLTLERRRVIIPVCSLSLYPSIKDSPIQLDHDSVSDGAFSEFGGEGAVPGREGPRSVMAGGSVKGWLPDVAVVLWRRMLGSLGRRFRGVVIRYQCCGSGMFIPDPRFFHPGSRI